MRPYQNWLVAREQFGQCSGPNRLPGKQLTTRMNPPEDMPAAPVPPVDPPRPILETVFQTLASVRFAVVTVGLVALACIVGTLLPQGSETAGFAQKYPGMAPWLPLFDQLGLTHVFHSWWFSGLLGVLAATVGTCSVRRFMSLRRTTGFAWRRALGSMLTHISILLILAGGVVRGLWGVKGYIELRAGETKAEFEVDDRPQPLPFAVQLTRFNIERYEESKPAGGSAQPAAHHLLVQWPERKLAAKVPIEINVPHSLTPPGETATADNTFHIKVLKYIPDFVMDSKTREVVSRSDEPLNPAILVEVKGPQYQNNRWIFAKFPDFVIHSDSGHGNQSSPLRITYEHGAVADLAEAGGPIKSFQSTLHLLEKGKVVRANTVEVNRPLSYQGYTFYQAGYNPRDLTWTSLEVVRDPGVPLVYTGFVLMIAGLFLVFYLNPWLESRKARA